MGERDVALYSPPLRNEMASTTTPDGFMCHLAVLGQADDLSTTTTWLEHVTDTDYHRPADGQESNR